MPAGASAPSRPLSQTLIGTWELVSRIDRTSSGERRVEPSLGDDPIALLYYDQTGHFAAQFMKRDRSAEAAQDTLPSSGASASNNSRAQGGYDAYFGEYTVDDVAGTVMQRLTGALSPENVGQVLTRAMQVDGETLTITLDTTVGGVAVTRTLTWRRAPRGDATATTHATRDAASAWLALVDASDSLASWKAAGATFRSAVSAEAWDGQLRAARGPLGALTSRTLAVEQQLNGLPGAPPGEYVVQQYHTVYGGVRAVVETLTLVRESDAAWRVVGYYIR